MTDQFPLIEQALQVLTMDVVINLTEHVQTLEMMPNGQLFSAYRDIDQTILVGYSEDLATEQLCLRQRNFVTLGKRRGTKKEYRLLLQTLKDLNIQATHNDSCFSISNNFIQQLIDLNWPVGNIKPTITQSLHRKNS